MVLIKSIVFFVAVVLIVLFALSNAHQIELRFITGEPFNVRLIYLVLFIYSIGVLSAAYFFFMWRIEIRRKRARKKQAESKENEEEVE
ncbi:MAG TPA: hypothetical protein VM492_14815 [Sumerlaeia bacterium]|nr:hypothetical protein [Sumerlaeia bacterium]